MDKHAHQWKNGKQCRIICAYCPCISLGTSSVYAQQTAGLAQQNIYTCPRKVFWDDLRQYVQEQQETGETVILMGDWNSDYTDLLTWMDALGFKDAIHSRHPQTTPPITCKRSNGQPLDAIFIPKTFSCYRGGYFAFDYLKSDHRGIWCDIPIEYLVSFKLQQISSPQARRLKTIDPRTTAKYLSILHKRLQENNTYSRQNALFELICNNRANLDTLAFETLDQQITEAMEVAEGGCCKLKSGGVKWSPAYQKACDEVSYWTLVITDMKGERTNTRKLRSLRKKLGFDRFTGILQTAETAHNKAIARRKQWKKQAETLQLEYRSQLVLAKEAEDNIKAATYIRNLSKQEAIRDLFQRIRFIEQRTSNLATTKVVIKQSNGQMKELFHQRAIEEAIMKENNKKFHQTEGFGQLQKGTLLRNIGVIGMGPKHKAIFQGSYIPPPGTNSATKSFKKNETIATGAKKYRSISFIQRFLFRLE
jgi:Exonuclease III